MEFSTVIIIVNTFASLFLAGVIWIVQLVHYPSFQFADKNEFKKFHNYHSVRISFIVVPAMLIELFTTSVLPFISTLPKIVTYTSLLLVILIWLSTFLIQVPIHNKLSHGYNKKDIDKLVRSNWIRTFLWSAKAILGYLLLTF